jgi:hypothetical protein
MTIRPIEHSILPRILAPLLAGLLFTAVWHTSSQAAPARVNRIDYVISDHDGYGLVECITQQKDCGKILADSWCESHGHGQALAFGRADDMTGSVPTNSSRQHPGSEAALVTCGE